MSRYASAWGGGTRRIRKGAIRVVGDIHYAQRTRPLGCMHDELLGRQNAVTEARAVYKMIGPEHIGTPRVDFRTTQGLQARPAKRWFARQATASLSKPMRLILAWAPSLSVESREAQRCAMCRTVFSGNWCIHSSLGWFDRNESRSTRIFRAPAATRRDARI